MFFITDIRTSVFNLFSLGFLVYSTRGACFFWRAWPMLGWSRERVNAVVLGKLWRNIPRLMAPWALPSSVIASEFLFINCTFSQLLVLQLLLENMAMSSKAHLSTNILKRNANGAEGGAWQGNLYSFQPYNLSQGHAEEAHPSSVRSLRVAPAQATAPVGESCEWVIGSWDLVITFFH